LEENEPKGITGWVFVFVSIGIILAIWLFVPSGGTRNQGEEVHSTSSGPTVHPVELSDTLSETIYLSTAGSGSRIDWDIVEEDVPLITVINGNEQHYQPARNSPDWEDLVLNNKILSIAWAVPAGYRGTVSYTISPK